MEYILTIYRYSLSEIGFALQLQLNLLGKL